MLGLRKSAECGVLHSACSAVHKTLPHPFFPLILRAAKQKRLKSQGPQAEAQGPHFTRVSQSQQWQIWVPNSKFIALSQKPPSFQVKHLLSCQGSRENTFLPCFSRRREQFLLSPHLFFSLWNYPFSAFDGPDISVSTAGPEPPTTWCILNRRLAYGN